MAHRTATPGPRSLTKREFLAGVQCHKQLWWRVHEPQAAELILDQNARVLYDGTFAREGIVVQVDMLERGSDGWTLIDVISSLDVKEKQLSDAAEVAEGRAASRELMQLLFGEAMDPQERSIMRESLLAYCEQDTWAIVRLLQRLRELAIDGG